MYQLQYLLIISILQQKFILKTKIDVHTLGVVFITTNLYGCIVFNKFVVPFAVDMSLLVLLVSFCSLSEVEGEDCDTLIDAVFIAGPKVVVSALIVGDILLFIADAGAGVDLLP